MGRMDSTDDRLRPQMFEDGNRVKFVKAVDQDGRDWWVKRFYEPLELTPEGMGDLITKSAGGDKLIKYEFIDGIGETFRLKVEGGQSGDGEMWFVERTFELQGNFFNADEMFISEKIRGQGIGRKLMGDLIDASRYLKVDRIKMHAQDIGRYAWLKLGFRPDAGSWRDIRKDLISAVFYFEDVIGKENALKIMNVISKGRPETANIIASLSNPVPSRVLRDEFMQPLLVPLGKALFLEWSGDWIGEFVLSDPEANRIANDYLKGDNGG